MIGIRQPSRILATFLSHVNITEMLLQFLLACALRIGRPPTTGLVAGVGEVSVASAEPALADGLRAGLARAMVRRGLRADAEGAPLTVEVLDASTAVAASADGVAVHRARLQIAVQLLGARPRRVVLTGERSYTVVSGETLGAAHARAGAFDELARELSEDAVDWILFGGGAREETP